MGILDFKEISNKVDDFELFASTCLPLMGFNIVSGPDRGPDEKRDMIAEKNEDGKIIRWLISCKHFAHGYKGKGRAVSKDDEPDVRDRLDHHNCEAVMIFCSTIPTNNLNKYLEGYVDKGIIRAYKCMNREEIEKLLLKDAEGEKLASRYFPNSYNNWVKNGKQSAIHYKLANTIDMLINTYNDGVITSLMRISQLKSTIIFGAKLNLDKIEVVEGIVNEIFDILRWAKGDTYTTEDLDLRFDKVDLMLEELEKELLDEYNALKMK
ncbi:hypothetical protein COJ48_24780 [Bacillus cereus]|nr:hypothetical protein COJ48_24780 [Bacillus cereus]PGP86667.1 hypothetical protein CN997_05890 [Bacillus cereus]